MFYPFRGGIRNRTMPPPELRKAYLTRVREMAFDGLELGARALGGPDARKDQILELRMELEGEGLQVLAVRTAAGLHNPEIVDLHRALLEKGVEITGWFGAGICNVTTTSSGTLSGRSSREAEDRDYEITARGIAAAADRAADIGAEISIEVHDGSIVDNSRSALRMLELVDRPNVGVNPDVKNMLRAKEVPDESWEDFFSALAPYTNYWHCKNVHRVHIPELNFSTLLYTSLSDGDINYRFAVKAMADAGFDGCLTLEGAVSGDQLNEDRKNAVYARSLIDDLKKREAGTAQQRYP